MTAQTLTARGERDYIRFARSLGRKIGAHAALIGQGNVTCEQYDAARAESDEAERLVRHIVQSVDNRHIAVIVSTFAGCPAHINFRRI